MAKTRQISFRLPESEYQKIAVVHQNAKERTLGYAPLGDVIREAIGLIPLKVITQEERDFLSGRISSLPGTKEHAPGPTTRPRVKGLNSFNRIYLYLCYYFQNGEIRKHR